MRDRIRSVTDELMLAWPELGTRVAVRYRRPVGAVPPLTDAVGHLLQVDPIVRIRTKTGAVVEFGGADVVAVRALSDTPVRTSAIRALEHAAALAWPGIEQRWLNGWFLRAGHGADLETNSAVPLDISADTTSIPAIVDWYVRRGLTPRLAVPDRLLRLPGAAEHPHRMLVRDASDARVIDLDASVHLTSRPDDAWLRLHGCELSVEVLTNVVDGELIFGACGGVAVGRAAVTNAPDGTRWVGLSAVRLAQPATEQPAPGCARALCETLLAWGAEHGASRCYVRVSDDDVTVGRLAESLGFTVHHRGRYLTAPPPA